MARNPSTEAFIDGILKFVVTGGAITLSALAPNILQVLDKPLTKYLDKMDERSKEREVRRIVSYMNRKGLVRYSQDYEHGLQLTDKGKQRALRTNVSALEIKNLDKWDHRWRLILFDVPESYKRQRNAFTVFLRTKGFYQLQKSVWLFPFPCRREVSIASSHFGINTFVTYIETAHIDREDLLIKKFAKLKLR